MAATNFQGSELSLGKLLDRVAKARGGSQGCSSDWIAIRHTNRNVGTFLYDCYYPYYMDPISSI